MNPPELVTPRLSLLDEEARRTAVQTVITTQEALTPEVINDLIEKFRRASKTVEGGDGLTAPQMMEIADDFPLVVKKLVRTIIRRRYSFPKYCETPGLYLQDQLESMLKWYERKAQHRIQMLQYAGDLDVISACNLQQYLLESIIPTIEQISHKEFWKTAFSLICIEGALMCCPSSRPNLISIKKLLASTILDEIDESVAVSDPSYDAEHIKWFSVQNMYVILDHFRVMDEDRKGMLTYDDFFRIGYLNPAFIKGFWNSPKCYKFPREVIIAGESETVIETDLSGLICFERALFNLTTFCNDHETSTCPMEYDSILSFVFRCLSENYDETYWTLKHFNYLVNCLRTSYLELDPTAEDQILLDDMRNIFLNYLNPKDPECITLADVQDLDSKLHPGSKSSAALFLGMLVDARKFRGYDNRENV